MANKAQSKKTVKSSTKNKQASVVYYSDLRAKIGTSLPQKLARLMKVAGFENIDFGQ